MGTRVYLTFWIVMSSGLAYGEMPSDQADPSVSPEDMHVVTQGSSMTVSCSFSDLGFNKVAWWNRNSGSLLSVGELVLTRAPRYKVTEIKGNGEVRSILTITDVRQSDAGLYECWRISNPPQSKLIQLEVLVPPENNSSYYETAENSTINMSCKAEGNPQPTVFWRRKDLSPILLRDIGTRRVRDVAEYEGDELVLNDVQRFDTGEYTCIARNGRNLTTTKDVFLQINYLPHVKTRQETVTVPIGKQVNLTCYVDSPPHTELIWLDRFGNVIFMGDKYSVREVQIGSTGSVMTLTITSPQDGDFGVYECVVRNSVGESRATVTLQEYTFSKGPESRAYARI